MPGRPSSPRRLEAGKRRLGHHPGLHEISLLDALKFPRTFARKGPWKGFNAKTICRARSVESTLSLPPMPRNTGRDGLNSFHETCLRHSGGPKLTVLSDRARPTFAGWNPPCTWRRGPMPIPKRSHASSPSSASGELSRGFAQRTGGAKSIAVDGRATHDAGQQIGLTRLSATTLVRRARGQEARSCIRRARSLAESRPTSKVDAYRPSAASNGPAPIAPPLAHYVLADTS